MQYEETLTFTNIQATTERSNANTNNVGSSKNKVDPAETTAYETSKAAALIGAPVAGAKWDNNTDPHWVTANASTQGLNGSSTSNTSAFSLTYTGNVRLDADANYSALHYFRITNSSLAALSIKLAVPTDWEIVLVTGLALVTNSSTIIEGTATGSGVVEIRLRPIPPVGNDVTPPLIYMQNDRTVLATVPASFAATVTDDDDAFPYNASFFWAFDYNGTAWNFSGTGFNFTFWTLGTYVVTFTAIDRSGNRADTTVNVTVDRPDKVPPVVSAGPPRTVTAGDLLSIVGSATDADPTFATTGLYEWSFTYNATPLNFEGASLDFTFFVPRVYQLTLSATDSWGNTGRAWVNVTVVSPDLEPPVAGAGFDIVVPFGSTVTFDGSATDNDPTFGANGRYWWTFTYNNYSVNISGASTTFVFSMAGTYEATFWAEDYWGNIASDLRVIVVREQDLVPPTVDALVDRLIDAGEPFAVTATVSDNDPDFPTGARFWWSFIYNGSLINFTGVSLSFTFAVPRLYTLSFFAYDAAGNVGTADVRVQVLVPDHQVPAVLAGDDFAIYEGQNVMLTGNASDNIGLNALAPMGWSFDGPFGPVNITGNPVNVTFPNGSAGEYVLTMWAQDQWGNIGTGSKTLTVRSRPADGSGSGAAPAPAAAIPAGLVPWALVAVAALGGGLVVVAARRRREEPESEISLASAAATDAAVLASLAPRGPSHVVEGLLILYKDGRLIHHQASSSGASLESPEVVGAMFTAVTEFIRDSLQEEGSLSRLSYGQNTILLEASANLFGAVVVYGEPDDELRETLRETLRKLELAYAGVVERWNGDRARFVGLEAFVAPIFAATSGLTRASINASTRDRTVRLVSATEHYKGYIRLRVAVINQTEARVSKATVTVMFNQTVLHLARVEPAGLAREGLTVHLGDIEPGERLGAIYYLDPQNCSTTSIEGIATYSDNEANQHEVKMKPRREEIVCPVFFTAQHANPASMRRLVETTLNARDSKVYRVLSLPTGVGYNDLFAIVREAVQRHHVVLIRNLATRNPFDGRVWFYGQTKHSKSAVVIRGTVNEERRTVEFFVAVDSPATLTGLLAEFNRSFTELLATRAPGARLDPILDDRMKGIMSPDEFGSADPEQE